MKKTIGLIIVMVLAAGIAQAATVSWDGDGSAYLNAATNWSDNTVPSGANDYVVGNNNNLAFAGAWGTQVDGNTSFGSLTFDTNGGGKFGIRSGTQWGRFLMSGDMTFASTMGVTETITAFSGANGTLSMGLTGNISIVNNSGQTLEFGNGSKGFYFSGWQNSLRVLTIGGNSDVVMNGDVTYSAATTGNNRALKRIWTDSAYTGTLTFRDGQNLTLGVGGDVRVQGGTVKIEGTDTIDDAVQLSYNAASSGASYDLSGLTDTVANLADFSSAAVGMTVDGSTDLVFANYRNGASTVGIDITGWVEGSSSLEFSALDNTWYVGTIGEGETFNGITIGGGNAYLTASGANWALTTIPEPATLSLVAIFGGFMVWLRRTRKI